MGLLHSAGSIADPSSDTGRRVWYLVLIAFIISIFRGRNS